MMGHLIKFSNFYGSEVPQNPIEIIKLLPKEEILATITAINARLKPIDKSYFDDSRETQIECLRVLFLDNNNHPSQSNCLKFILKYLRTPENHNLFSRVTCLYAFQEVIDTEGFVEATPEYTIDLRERILKYLLSVNESILLFDQEYSGDDHKTLGKNFFEYFMFKELPHNQYYATSNSINLFFKAFSLFKAIDLDNTFGNHLRDYLKETFGVESMNDFFKNQMYSYFVSYDKILKFQYIKKSPLYKNSGKDGKDIITYLVLDNTLLIEKTYSLFINDFWFDYLKVKNICNRTDWGNFIGSVFFEPFLEEILNNSFKNNKRTVLKATDDLKFKLNGRDEIEYADFYVRESNKIIIAEAKSNYLPVVNGYKTVKTIADYQALNLNKFYKDYGLTQLTVKTVKLFHDYKMYIKDMSFNFKRKVTLFPVLVVNDPIFSSGLASFAFKRKFEHSLIDENIEIENETHKIMPLTIINVSDFQDMEQSLHDGDENIFNIIRYFHSISSKKRIPTEGTTVVLKTIEHAINKRIKRKLIANRIKNLTWLE
ncbi:hypothetical protein CSC81_04085 [Tenacibaculum discolor]|uniref:Uncharacterized protein n=1 Tax=Tenacibaculum discolor TaxID=361581 RepID=A0A2G1BXC3_9FLAO|nr:hypothetical protein [Tenacibaculum discolor]MDP2540725.1 hypothetical protein [Tenacibaculum discolor]PHN98680.1 hypothetical protein CSC81_04085 [Tenacibaculum discolor]